eukprot:TRINITY_DN3336_c0_g1_i1.p5 TRINITY_DN3336_c0_g1~~TRINITY_DN3336_c0_g1_i1.p5  ORF type:complete len:200 (-),score=-12.26 TRINITY_DN3336_c0_g1_i1:1468-2043(-)
MSIKKNIYTYIYNLKIFILVYDYIYISFTCLKEVWITSYRGISWEMSFSIKLQFILFSQNKYWLILFQKIIFNRYKIQIQIQTSSLKVCLQRGDKGEYFLLLFQGNDNQKLFVYCLLETIYSELEMLYTKTAFFFQLSGYFQGYLKTYFFKCDIIRQIYLFKVFYCLVFFFLDIGKIYSSISSQPEQYVAK